MPPKKDWSIYTVDILKVECGKRSLVRSGTKADLISRLETCESQNATPLQSSGPPANAPAGPALEPSSLSVSNPSERELEKLCQENWTPYTSDPQGHQRRETIFAEQRAKHTEAVKKKDAAIARARAKCEKALEECRAERDERVKELQSEVEKRKSWMWAFGRLKELRAKKGMTTSASDYRPDRVQEGGSSVREKESGCGSDQVAAASKHARAVAKEKFSIPDEPDRRIRISPSPTPSKSVSISEGLGKSQGLMNGSTSATMHRTQPASLRNPVSASLCRKPAPSLNSTASLTSNQTQVTPLKSDGQPTTEAKASAKRSASDAFPEHEQRGARSGFNFIGFRHAAHHTCQPNRLASALDGLPLSIVAAAKPQVEAPVKVELPSLDSEERAIVIE
ncbi:hypothetical protein GLAREA_08481 [Glarea lozoyensis ATCC 20868]|uniref:SAP domain-containing protein n=1 Tax=Glarea lozoyensis (strain ATCC 20868 / MF5171) TaxID=1116229 RepID=S3DD67_GLAL2|nr:uncharacterized protein GLAREA_08481 [Glarea lozoyensis ATCC 20868]EPE24628.1 hypothetical protein GLAREA_08481 [Glarea lozoyensis ATCC 20868]